MIDEKTQSFSEESFSEEEIVNFAQLHLEHLAKNEGWQWEGIEFFILSSITSSSELHDVVLPIWKDANGHVIVVGSFGGSDKEPDWVANLRRKTGLFYTRDEFFVFEAEFLSGIERTSIWEQLCADRPYYLDYQKKTTREFPLIRIKNEQKRIKANGEIN